jgi:hypothetical protein
VGLGPVVARARVCFTRYLIVVPRPLLAAALAVRRRYFIVVPRTMPAAPLAERRRYLIVAPRLMPAAPHRYLMVAPRPRPAAARRNFGRGFQATARGAGRCASQVLDLCARPLPAAPLVVRCRHLSAVPRPLPAAALVTHRRAVSIYRGAQAVSRGGARCASKILERFARPLPAAPRR